MATAEQSRSMTRQAPARSDNATADQVNAIAGLPEGLAVMKMENDNIMALASARPRNMTKIREELEEALDAFPAQAAKLIYAKPVGTKPAMCRSCRAELMRKKGDPPPRSCPGCKSTDIDPGGMQFARGLSVRAAEMLSEVYGYNSTRAASEDIDDRTARVYARFFDYQKGRIWEDSGIVSKYYTSSKGISTKIPDDRFWNLTVKAEKSRMVREVTLRSVNAGLKAWLFEKAEEMIDGLLDDSTINKIIANFANKQVSKEMLEGVVGRTLAMGWTKDDRKQLVGMWAALESGDSTVGELFGGPDVPPPPPPKVKQSALNSGDAGDGETGDEGPTGEEPQVPPEDQAEAAKSDEDELVMQALERIAFATTRQLPKIVDEYRPKLPEERMQELSKACDARRAELQEGK